MVGSAQIWEQDPQEHKEGGCSPEHQSKESPQMVLDCSEEVCHQEVCHQVNRQEEDRQEEAHQEEDRQDGGPPGGPLGSGGVSSPGNAWYPDRSQCDLQQGLPKVDRMSWVTMEEADIIHSMDEQGNDIFQGSSFQSWSLCGSVHEGC